jgi:hypothetical protein
MINTTVLFIRFGLVFLTFLAVTYLLFNPNYDLLRIVVIVLYGCIILGALAEKELLDIIKSLMK